LKKKLFKRLRIRLKIDHWKTAGGQKEVIHFILKAPYLVMHVVRHRDLFIVTAAANYCTKIYSFTYLKKYLLSEYYFFTTIVLCVIEWLIF